MTSTFTNYRIETATEGNHTRHRVTADCVENGRQAYGIVRVFEGCLDRDAIIEKARRKFERLAEFTAA